MTGKPAHQLTLAEAVDLIVYGASCEVCRETRRIDLHALLDRFGPDFVVDGIRPRLRCLKCGGSKVICVTLWKTASTTEKMTEHWR